MMVEALVWVLLWLAEARDWLVDRSIRALCVAVPWRFRMVPDAVTGAPMLRQFALIRGGSWLGKRFGACYLQHFDRPEPATFAHRHRWEAMRSWVLSGAFIEERFYPAELQCLPRPTSELVGHIAGERYAMDRAVIHRVAYWSQRCWTLFRMSPEQSDAWGYYAITQRGSSRSIDSAQLIPWRKHIAKRVPSLDTGKLTQ